MSSEQHKICSDRLFDALDFDKNGKLSKTEIFNFLILASSGDKESKIKSAFQLYDVDKSGKLDRAELTDYFTGVIKLSLAGNNVSSKQVKDLAAATAKKCFDVMDLNKDGQICLQEFTQFVLNGGDASASNISMLDTLR